MLRVIKKPQSVNGDPIPEIGQYSVQLDSLRIPKINHEKELLSITPIVSKFSFQRQFKGFDAVQFCDNRINLFDSQCLTISHSFGIPQIEKVKILLKKNDEQDEKSDYTLILSIVEITGNIFKIHFSEILRPYCQELAEGMEKILAICTDKYHLPILLGVPFAY
ncbi:MAG: hypothetical protein ACTSWL_04235 [Promethearchaeota archaeon]